MSPQQKLVDILIVVAFFASQVACILSEAEVVDGMLDYWKFVPVAAKILQVRPCYNAQY